MKDRMLIHDESLKIIYTEDRISPDEIFKYDKNRIIFIKRIKQIDSDNICRIGIYNFKELEIECEISVSKEIFIDPYRNLFWVKDINQQKVLLYKLKISNNLIKFDEVFKTHFETYDLLNDKKGIFFDLGETILVTDLSNIKSLNFEKKSNLLFDKNGFYFEIQKNTIKYKKFCDNQLFSISYNGLFVIKNDQYRYLYKGKEVVILGNYESDLQRKKENEELVLNHFGLIDNHVNISHQKNQNNLNKYFSFEKKISEVFPTEDGVLILEETTSFASGYNLIKDSEVINLFVFPNFTKTYIYKDGKENIFPYSSDMSFNDYSFPILVCKSKKEKIFFNGSQNLKLSLSSDYKFIDNTYYFLLNKRGQSDESSCRSLYLATNLNNPLFEDKLIYNLNNIDSNKSIWFQGKKKDALEDEKYDEINDKEKYYIRGYNLIKKEYIEINEFKSRHLLLNDASDYKINDDYILSSNRILLHPNSGNIKSSVTGEIKSTSKSLDKVLSCRKHLFYLNIFNNEDNIYEYHDIPIDHAFFQEAHLSPDGKKLVYKKDDEYCLYDYLNNKKITFFSGRFISFTKEGNLLLEEQSERNAKILDPLTLEDITPAQYHYYKYISPNGKLFASISKSKEYNYLLDDEIWTQSKWYNLIKQNQNIEHKKWFFKKNKILINRYNESLINQDNEIKAKHGIPSLYKVHGLKDWKDINYLNLFSEKQYIEIGIVGTELTKRIYIPDDLKYYNYACFSFDNQYFAWVGKPKDIYGYGFVSIYKIDFNELNDSLEVSPKFVEKITKKATWLCGFSRNNQLATYDSVPDVYFIDVMSDLQREYENLSGRFKFEKLKNIRKNQMDSVQVIRHRSFLCFSPSGKLMLLSDNGYSSILAGGFGHHESSRIWIYDTNIDKVVFEDSLHGESIKLASFSSDENNLLTISEDGVIIIRKIETNIFNNLDINMNKIIEEINI